MSWHIVLVGLGVTLVAAVIQFGIVRAVPNYDDGDEIPPWLTTTALGVVLSLVAGWLT